MYKIEMQGIEKAYGHDKPVIENLDLHIRTGSFTVLLGPSGCGKSTILRMIAGLEKETNGSIFIDGKNMKNVEPGDRNIAMVFQNYALYPTMTVRENIEFGLKNMKVPKEERQKRIDEISQVVGLTEYLGRKPQNLSGGQRQRVALARAIVKKPSVFLMDEPLSNLDAKLRNQIRTELIELHRRLKATFVYVTHDQIEAMSMGTDIVLMQKGEIMQQSDPLGIYNRPANLFAAQFIGSPPMNVLNCHSDDRYFENIPQGAEYAGFRPERTRLSLIGEKTGKSDMILFGDLITHEMLGSETLCKVNTPQGQVHAKIYDSKALEYGPVQVSVRQEDLYFFGNDQRLLSHGKAEGAYAK